MKISRTIAVIWFVTLGFVLAQAPRPPVDKLSLLRDVSITSPTNTQVLTFNSVTGKWENQNAAGGGIGGSIADQQVAFGVGTSIGGSDNLKWDNSAKKLTLKTTTYSPEILIIDGSSVEVGRIHFSDPSPAGGNNTANTFLGAIAGETITTGKNNTAVGWYAMNVVTTGSYNTSLGIHSGSAYNTGDNNTCIGANSDLEGDTSNGTVLGALALVRDPGGVAIGKSATAGGVHSVAIGENATSNDDNTITLGNQEVSDIYCGFQASNSTVHANAHAEQFTGDFFNGGSFVGDGSQLTGIPFTNLSDVPNSYSGFAGRHVIVNATADGLVFSSPTPTPTPTATATATATPSGTATSTPTATATATPLSIFKTISIPGQSDVVADSDSDTLNINTVGNISATTNASTDTITLTVPTPTATSTFTPTPTSTPTATSTSTSTPTPTATPTATPTPELSTIGTPTYSTVQHFFNAAMSTGSWSGGTITASGTANAVDVAAGTGFIKATDSNVATQSFFNWSASTALSVPSNTVRYIGVQYNAGTPNVVAKTSDSWDYDTEFPLGICVNEGGTRYIVNNTWNTGDNQTNLIERFDSLANIARDNRLGGLILGTTGTRNVTVSAGSLMDRMSEFAITAIDTSGSGTFDAYYRDGSGGWTKQAAQTQYDVTKYDNSSGTLANLTVLDYSSRWFYLMTDGTLAMVYGQNQFVSLALGLGDTVPSAVPPRIQAMGMLIGRLVIQQGVNAPAATQTVFTTTFSSNSVQNHNDLANIQGGSSGQYYHLTSAEYTGTGTGNFVRATSPTLVTPVLGTPASGDGRNMSAATDSVTGEMSAADHTTFTSLSAATATGVAPAFVAVGLPVVAFKSGVNFQANGTTDIFTVPTSRTFVVRDAWIIPTSITSGANIAIVWKIIESGASGAMTAATASTSTSPLTTKAWPQYAALANSGPFVMCAAGNKVQFSITTAWTTSTTVTGNVFVFGFYAQ
jgi:hypothetical protein